MNSDKTFTIAAVFTAIFIIFEIIMSLALSVGLIYLIYAGATYLLSH